MATFPEEVLLFDRPSTGVVYEKIQYVDYRPTSQLSNGGSLEFVIPPTVNQYINLKKTYLKLKLRIVKSDGSAVPNDVLVSCINLPLHTIFNQVDVLLQQQLVSSTGSQTYAYKSYFETMLEYGSDAKQSQLRAQGFYKDNKLDLDVSNLVDVSNKLKETKVENWGYVKRWMLFKANNIVDFIGPLNADICQQNRLILNGVEIQIRMWPSKDAFRLLTTDATHTYKMEVVDATLKVCKVTPAPALLLAHAEGLKSSPALYPYSKTQMKTFNVPKDQYNFHLDDLFQGDVPSHLVIGMVKSKAFSGDYALNPFNMQHFSLSSLGVYVNDESLPGKPLQMSFDEGLTVDAYQTLFTGLDQLGNDWGNDIDRQDFGAGSTFFVFDLLPGNHPQLTPNVQKANIRIEGVFSKALEENATVIIYGKFPALMKITEDRTILI